RREMGADGSMRMLLLLVAASGAALAAAQQSAAPRDERPVTALSRAISKTEFVFETAPFASAHASTIVETSEGLVAAWFGGTREGASDVAIWVSRHAQGKWIAPIEVATGLQPDGVRYPCWNPVLFKASDTSLLLFYKVGPSPQAWWGLVRA